jgi:hypothetical protein
MTGAFENLKRAVFRESGNLKRVPLKRGLATLLLVWGYCRSVDLFAYLEGTSMTAETWMMGRSAWLNITERFYRWTRPKY